MAAYQQGVTPLLTGVTEYTVTFPSAFSDVPNLIVPEVFNSDPLILTPLWIEAVVTTRTATYFTVALTQAPDDNSYLMSWFVGDMNQTIVAPGLPGISMSGLPEFRGEAPNNSYLPIVVPGPVSSTKIIRISDLKLTFSAGTRIATSQITDASATGRTVLTGTAASARTALSVPAISDVQAARDMESSATAFGKSILTSSSDVAARTLLNVSSTSVTAAAVTMEATATALGKSLLTAATAAAARTLLDVPATGHTHTLVSLGAAATLHTHPTTDITGPSFITGFLTSASATTALPVIGAMPQEGWKTGYTSVISDRTISAQDLGSKLLVSANSILTFNTAITSSLSGKLGIYVLPGITCVIQVSGATLINEAGETITPPYTAEPGYYEVERVDTGTWILRSAIKRAIRQALYQPTLTDFKAALALTPADFGVSATIESFLEATTPAAARTEIQAQASVLPITYISSSGLEVLSDHFTGSPESTLFILTGPMILQFDDIGTMPEGSYFEMYAATADVTLQEGGTISINPGIAPPYYASTGLPAGTCIRVYATDTTPGAEVLVADLIHQQPVYDVVWVSADNGNNSTARIGRPEWPYAGLKAASLSSAQLIIVTPGEYPVSATDTLVTSARWWFMPGARVTHSAITTGAGGAPGVFSTNATHKKVRVYGYGEFTSAIPVASVPVDSYTGEIDFECDSTVTAGSSFYPVFFMNATTTATALRTVIRKSSSRPLGSFIQLVGTYVITANVTLTNATVTVNEFITPNGLYRAYIVGGKLYLSSTLIYNDSTTSASRADFQGQALIGNQSDGLPATITTNTTDFLRIDDCTTITPTITPGTGVLVIRNSVLTGDIDLDSDNLLLVNCTHSHPTHTIALNTFDLNVAGTLTTSGVAPTVVGGTAISLPGLGTLFQGAL